MELGEFVQNCLKYYRENVKPLIEKKDFGRASVKMYGLLETIDERGSELLVYHSALQCAAFGQRIQEHLRSFQAPPVEVAREFEARLAQVGLAVSSRNKLV